jgi:hypothetical protein
MSQLGTELAGQFGLKFAGLGVESEGSFLGLGIVCRSRFLMLGILLGMGLFGWGRGTKGMDLFPTFQNLPQFFQCVGSGPNTTCFFTGFVDFF